ncbi:integral membrane protein dgcr2 idd [Willisornis vidua]|uniref:Integral membrane protein dgcr2 idd n=1 Tax=Willisornis vidua TaxID=1566151 RepID=A0ABQ9DAN7_9PASS|nr:integral membrane protein dgcr2 idd [Willisornis vidua]
MTPNTRQAHNQLAVNQYSKVILSWDKICPFQTLFLESLALDELVELQLDFVGPHTVVLSPSIQSLQILQNLPTFQHINPPAQLGVICKLIEDAPLSR